MGLFQRPPQSAAAPLSPAQQSYYPPVEPLGSTSGHPASALEQQPAAYSPLLQHTHAHSPPPSAPPLHDPAPHQHHHHHPVQPASQQQQQQAPAPPQGPRGQVLVSAPTIEAQPWVRSLLDQLATKTIGVARVDLRRPTFLWPEDYDDNNILFRRGQQGARRGRGRPRKQQPIVGYAGDADGPYFPGNQQQQGGRGMPTGARLKVMRCVQLKAPEDKRALLDFGLGVGVDLDRQELHGVARLKLGGLLSLKLMPRPMLKLGGAWPLPGRSGLALRLKYEVPLAALGEFWAPPARLMVRLDNDVGTGVHLTPTGIEFDERRLTLGDSTEVRAGATLRFPRTLPIDRDDPDAFKLHVHRLSLKTLW